MVVVLALAGCKEGGQVTAARFTVYPGAAGACVVVADLVSTRNSSNVDVTLRACAGEVCSAASREMTEGPFMPGRAKTVQLELGGCPDGVDRIDVDVSRWGSINNALSVVEVARVEKAPRDGGGCDARVVLRPVKQIGDSLVFLVARDREGRPLDRTLPFPVPESKEMSGHQDAFASACEAIDRLDVQVVQ